MQHEKVFEATVNVANPINFCTDTSGHLLTELRNQFAGRCYKGAYILNINRIAKQSACHLLKTNNSGEGYIDVSFIADVIVIARWDILTGVKVVNRQQMLRGSYEAIGTGSKIQAAVTVLASKGVESVAVDQLIAVRVVVAQHPAMQPKVSVIGTLLTCDSSAPVYRIRGNLDGTARAELAPMLAQIEEELALRKELIKNRREDLWFFERLLYSYRQTDAAAAAAAAATATVDSLPTYEGGLEWDGPPPLLDIESGAESRNILDIVYRVVHKKEAVLVTGVWSRSLRQYRSSPAAAMAVTTPDDWVPSTDSTPRVVFAIFLKNILDFLSATRELTMIYNTPALIASHFNIWNIMRAEQKTI